MKSRTRKTRRFTDPYGEFAYKYNAAHCCCDTEDVIQLPASVGAGSINRFFLRGGMEITLADFQLERELSIDFMAAPYEAIDLCCCLKGSYRYDFGDAEAVLHSGRYQVRRCGGLPYSMKFPAGERVVFLEVRTEFARILPCADRKEERNGCSMESLLGSCEPYVASGRLPLGRVHALEGMLNCPYFGHTKLLFLEGRALEWIAYCVNRHFCGKQDFAAPPSEMSLPEYAELGC